MLGLEVGVGRSGRWAGWQRWLTGASRLPGPMPAITCVAPTPRTHTPPAVFGAVCLPVGRRFRPRSGKEGSRRCPVGDVVGIFLEAECPAQVAHSFRSPPFSPPPPRALHSSCLSKTIRRRPRHPRYNQIMIIAALNVCNFLCRGRDAAHTPKKGRRLLTKCMKLCKLPEIHLVPRRNPEWPRCTTRLAVSLQWRPESCNSHRERRPVSPRGGGGGARGGEQRGSRSFVAIITRGFQGAIGLAAAVGCSSGGVIM